MDNNLVIKVDHVDKVYKLYNSNKDRVLDTFGIGKQRGRDHFALSDISFDVKKGECVGIIGTNGSGKSTMLKIITGVLSPTKGKAEVNGRISALLELGAGFNAEYTGMENIYLNGTMLGYSREEIDARLPEILDFADIGDYVNQPVKSYSSGMFVRLAFAVAINIDPEILIVDEALSVGDVFFQAKCYKKFEDFKSAGKTILFVSHDLGAISKYCDRAILINRGHKVAEGTPKEMIGLYKKILVGQEPVAAGQGNAALSGEGTADGNSANSAQKLWKSHYKINPNVDEYGSGKAEIIDFAIIDEAGDFNSSILKGGQCTIKSKVRFNETIENPIFTMSLKTQKGIEVTGTNTMFEGVETGICEAGSEYVASFTQNMDMQGGSYLLSISCTGFVDGTFTAYHRLYDVTDVFIISDKNTVGFYDSNSVVTVEKAE